MSAVQSDHAFNLAELAWKKLSRRRWWLSGWAYNFGVPLDADSTIWAIRLAENLREDSSPRIQRAYKFLLDHRNSDGGFATYSHDSSIYRHIGLANKQQSIGWMASHTCVSAAAASLSRFREDEELLQYLQKSQNAWGSWTGYWWSDDEFTTSLALEALIKAKTLPELGESFAVAISWLSKQLRGGRITTSIQKDGSPFATASALKGLLAIESLEVATDIIAKAIAWLIDDQLADGSWRSSARLRIPAPNITDVKSIRKWSYDEKIDAGTIKMDFNRIFTTATVISALATTRNSLKL